MVQPLSSRPCALLFSFSTIFTACAASAVPGEAHEGPPPEDAIAYVDPSGSDDGPGTRDAPFRTFARALADTSRRYVVVSAGRYAETVSIVRPVEVRGPVGRQASVDGHMTIGSHSVRIAHVDFSQGVSLRGAVGVALADARIGAGGGDHALRVENSGVELARVALTCGRKTCIRTSSSTLRLDDVRIDGPGERGLLIETSTATVRGLKAKGPSFAAVQVGAGGVLDLADSELSEAAGNGLVAIAGARLRVERTRIEGVRRFAIVTSESRAVFRRVTAGKSGDISVGIHGGTVLLEDCAIDASAQGVINVSDYLQMRAEVTIRRGVIRHRDQTGLGVSQGKVVVQDTHFVGETGRHDGDAIAVSGLTSEVYVTGALIERPAGYGIGIYGHASGTVSATITSPGTGGVIVESTAGQEVSISNTVVRDCGAGNGVVVFDALGVEVNRITVSGCGGAGVLAGDGAEVRLSNALLVGNAQYGIAAFGGSVIDVEGARVRGSPWGAFASCADGARIIDRGHNQLGAHAMLCP